MCQVPRGQDKIGLVHLSMRIALLAKKLKLTGEISLGRKPPTVKQQCFRHKLLFGSI